MPISNKAKTQIEATAENTLTTFDAVALAARTRLTDTGSSSGAETFASINTFTSTDTLRSQEKINQENVDSYRLLSREPAVARVVVRDENNKDLVYFICRTAPVSVDDKSIKLASYRSPIGRIASLSVGDATTVHLDGRNVSVEILEKAELYPALVEQEWDSHNTVLEASEYGVITVESLRAFLSPALAPEPDSTLLEQQLDEELQLDKHLEGRRRNIIEKMGLRDQPVLDRYQDEIFRLPLNSKLLILGAPGTGKTTTLIRRLGQKIDPYALTENEHALLALSSSINDIEHKNSWIMFTPTELLRHYVKEAFAREAIAAPDERICTWRDFRRQLARRTFNILRSSSGGGTFVMREHMDILLPDTIHDQIAWYTDFDTWQKARFWREMSEAAQHLSKSSERVTSALGNRILSLIMKDRPELSPTLLVELHGLGGDIQAHLSEMMEITDRQVRRSLNLQVNLDHNFLNDLAQLLDSLAGVEEDPDDPELDEVEETTTPRTRRIGPAAAFEGAARSLARSEATGRSIGETTRTGRVIEWLGDRLPDKQDRGALGQSLLVQSQLRRFVNPLRRYLTDVPRRYRRFRRERQSENKWYRRNGYATTDIQPLEVDLVLLALLRGADELVRNTRSAQRGDAAENSMLTRQRQLAESCAPDRESCVT